MPLVIFAPSINHIQPLIFRAQWKTATGIHKPSRISIKKRRDCELYTLLSIIQNAPGCRLWHSCQRLLSPGLPRATSFRWQGLKALLNNRARLTAWRFCIQMRSCSKAACSLNITANLTSLRLKCNCTALGHTTLTKWLFSKMDVLTGTNYAGQNSA